MFSFSLAQQDEVEYTTVLLGAYKVVEPLYTYMCYLMTFSNVIKSTIWKTWCVHFIFYNWIAAIETNCIWILSTGCSLAMLEPRKILWSNCMKIWRIFIPVVLILIRMEIRCQRVRSFWIKSPFLLGNARWLLWWFQRVTSDARGPWKSCQHLFRLKANFLSWRFCHYFTCSRWRNWKSKRQDEWLKEWETWTGKGSRISTESLQTWKDAMRSIFSENGIQFSVGDGEVAYRKRIVRAICKLVPPVT